MNYMKCDHTIHDLIGDVCRLHHPELIDAEVTIGALWALPGENGEPTLKLHGYSAAAVMKINSYRDRVEGKPDATITIDRATWEGLNDKQQLALIDHELHHLELQYDDEGQLKSDDLGRPRMKMRLHDHEIGVFTTIIDRHGSDCLDSVQVAEIVKAYKQTLLAFMDDDSALKIA